MAKGNNLFVSYDLVHPDENYDRLARAIGALGNAAKISSTLWYVDAPMSGAEAAQKLRALCHPADSLIVIDATANSAPRHNLSPVAEDKIAATWNAPPRNAPADVTRPLVTAPLAQLKSGDAESGWLGRLFGAEGREAA